MELHPHKAVHRKGRHLYQIAASALWHTRHPESSSRATAARNSEALPFQSELSYRIPRERKYVREKVKLRFPHSPIDGVAVCKPLPSIGEFADENQFITAQQSIQ